MLDPKINSQDELLGLSVYRSSLISTSDMVCGISIIVREGCLRKIALRVITRYYNYCRWLSSKRFDRIGVDEVQR